MVCLVYTYIYKYNDIVGGEQYPFENDMEGYLISYLENWLKTDIDSTMNEPGILEPEDPFEQNNDENLLF